MYNTSTCPDLYDPIWTPDFQKSLIRFSAYRWFCPYYNDYVVIFTHARLFIYDRSPTKNIPPQKVRGTNQSDVMHLAQHKTIIINHHPKNYLNLEERTVADQDRVEMWEIPALQ